MKKKLLILMSLLTCTIGMRAADIDKALPSDWGGWQNLTYGVTDSTTLTVNLFPMEVETTGNIIHLLWQENGKDSDGLYRMYYRRSTDLGRTWEDAKLISTSPEKLYVQNNHLLTVSGSSVYIFCPSVKASNNHLRCARSTDGGASFTTIDLEQFGTGSVTQNLSQYYAASDGQTVVFASRHTDGSGHKELRAYTSTDGGENFKLLKWQLEGYSFGGHGTYPTYQQIADLQIKDGKWTMVCWDDDKGAKIVLNSSSDGGKTLVTQNVTQQGTGRYNYWSNMPGYRPQMLMQGNTIDLIYHGKLNDGDSEKIVYQRSTDGGQTWGEPQYLPDSREGTMTIAGKGDNLYVLGNIYSGSNDYYGHNILVRTLWYSHDGGKTWQQQRQGLETFSLGNAAFRLTIAPDDPTGKHVLLTGEQGFYLESKDGFQTIYRNFRVGEQSWVRKDWNNQPLTVLYDNDGTEHWFMQYSQLNGGIGDSYYWNIYHRRVERPEAATSSKEMAYHLTRTTYNDIIIPMSPSIMATSEAMTVEAWVRFDAASGSFGLASLNNDKASLGGYQSYYGWFLDLYYQSGGATPGGLAFNGGVRPEQANGTGLFTPWKYLIREMGQWHHVAMTYDSNLSQDNVHFYIDGLPYNSRTEHGKIPMGNNPLLIGRSNTQSDGDVLIDNFALYSRALTLDEIHQHIYGKPDAKDKDCCLLLTFDGTLRDQSQYHNDPVPLMENPLVEHNGINLPKADFTLTKDTKGTTVYVNDVTPDGEVYWWFKPSATSFGTYNESNKKHESVDYTGHSANYTFWMVAKGDGETTNAFAPVSKDFSISGLSKVFPEAAGQYPIVKVRIQGGYQLNNNNKPRVLLKQGDTEIEGQWEVEKGYDVSKITSLNDLAPACFNLWDVPIGKYDVIVGNDTLQQAFTLEQHGEGPDVWMQVNGRGRMLWNRYWNFSIDYGNKSNVPAYNTPMFICIPSRKETVDVQLNFDVNVTNDAFDDELQQTVNQWGDHLMAYDKETGDSVLVYSFLIPYIGPNSTNHLSFRLKAEGDADYENMRINYSLGEPWGPYVDDDEEATTRAAVDDSDYWIEEQKLRNEKRTCALTMFSMMFYEYGFTAIPLVGCGWSVIKTIVQGLRGKDRSIEALGANIGGAAFACGSDLLGGTGMAVKAGVVLATMIYDLKFGNGPAFEACQKGDPNWRNYLFVNSLDPNEMFGPAGPDDNAHYIKPIHQMPYMITFENKSTASAPANEVFVTDTLDLTKLDAETFSFSSFGWADTTLVVGGSRTQEFTRDVNYKVNGHDILVRVSGQFNPETGVVNWSFASLEKNGNELDDVMNGFLLPNDQNGRGEGYVSFTIEHKPNPANGSTISNKATIIFDANKPIVTNTYVNTFDTDYPTSKVTKVEEQDGQLTVTIQGSDKTSGIDHYTLFAFVNGSDSAIVVANYVTGTQASFACEPGTKYGLCAIATDRVGHNEPKDVKVEKEFTTSGDAPATATYDLKVADAGYATFYDSKDHYQLPAGLKASTVSGISGGKLSYQSISGNIVPKGTAVLIEATEKKAATYTLTATTVADGSAVGTNLLYGSDETTTTSAAGTNLFYKLAYGPSGTSLAKSFGWFWGAQNGAPFSIDGHRAWLAVPSGAAARGYLINGEETTIEGLGIDADANSIWTDLQGRRLTKPTQPGIYFRDGRKVVVK